MMTLRKAAERGAADHGWLKSHHTFSFADYYDPANMGFGPLRVINEDYIAPGMGFGAHPHRDMEIITYVISGAVRHRDSMGNEGVILPGQVQHMTAGTGVVHSEFSDGAEPTHLLQIWIQPDRAGHKPGYGQKSFEDALASSRLVRVVSPDGRGGSVPIHQDASLFVSRTAGGDVVPFDIGLGRRAWVQIVHGRVRVESASGSVFELGAGDAVAVTGESSLKLNSIERSEALIFDLP